ncbi:hypothetical protein FRC03_000245 [Tulasnella sp. 419]|nr:hypothetical protein FRC02_009110 [Tulasnella sp. 418]KAG8965705.1 hypothetical protein FRC03_000245 [Tulasnella sp. 419]
MSLAPPTRPLPSPLESSSTRQNHNQQRSPPRSTAPRPSSRNSTNHDLDHDQLRKDKERDRTSQILNGVQTSPSKRPGASPSAAPSAPSPPNIQLHVNDMSDKPTDWGANFWVTIMDPMTQAIFYACPSTGETSWDPPQETFLMPLNDDGHWWELADESREGMPYYYHTKTQETQWTRPDGFVIPLGIIQNTTTLGRRLSLSTAGRSAATRTSSISRRTASFRESMQGRIPEEPESEGVPGTSPPSRPRRLSSELASPPPTKNSGINTKIVAPLPTIPASPDVTSATDTTPNKSKKSKTANQTGSGSGDGTESPSPRRSILQTGPLSSLTRSKTAPAPSASGPQSFGGVGEMLAKGSGSKPNQTNQDDTRAINGDTPTTPPKLSKLRFPGRSPKEASSASPILPSPKRPIPSIPMEGLINNDPTQSHLLHANNQGAQGGTGRPRRDTGASNVSNGPGNSPAREIGMPIPDPEAAAKMAPLKVRPGGHKPIFVDPPSSPISKHRLSTGDAYVLPKELQEDIQQFAVEEFARRYFSTHRTGLIFRRRVPVERMMSWQKAPLTAPLLVLNRSLHKDAVKTFKVIQRIMGDRDREKPIGVKLVEPASTVVSGTEVTDGGGPSASMVSLGSGNHATRDPFGILEEERWMLSEGLAHGELRDEIYCQVVKQLSNNPNPESTFHGWQLLCVLLVTFPPSKNFEAYLRTFMQERLTKTEGRIDVMAKYCISRLSAIAKKGPRGKAPTTQEIETAADAAFNPSTFGESLESIFRLQQRTYPDGKVPIILPFLADSIIALGGTKREGIFRIPGDGDAVSDLKVRIDKGHYNLQGIDDPHVPASLLKLWLRELQEPLIPTRMYNDCIAVAEDWEKCVEMVRKLPTINRRVTLFIVSFLQLFLSDSVCAATKMTSPNLALVMAPNLLRCNSDSVAVVFTNAKFEHMFVHNLLLHLKCSKIDPDYAPVHGLGASSSSGSLARPVKSARPRTGTS